MALRGRPAPARPPSVSAALHARPTLEVALLAAALVEERHPRLARVVTADERPRRRRVQDAAALLRATTTDPVRALGLAARERAVGGDPHVRPEGHDPDLLALRHALRVHCVLLTAAAAGGEPTPAAAESYVREQRSTAVLLGAEPDDLPATLAEVAEDVAAVRAEVEADPAPVTAALGGHRDGCGDGCEDGAWHRVSRLALGVLPPWARPGPVAVDPGGLTARLRRL